MSLTCIVRLLDERAFCRLYNLLKGYRPISRFCRVDICQSEDTILSNVTIKKLIGDKCHGVLGQLTEVTPFLSPFHAGSLSSRAFGKWQCKFCNGQGQFSGSTIKARHPYTLVGRNIQKAGGEAYSLDKAAIWPSSLSRSRVSTPGLTN